MSAGHDQFVAFMIERHPADMGNRLVLEISEATVELEGVETLCDRTRAQRTDLDRRGGIGGATAIGEKGKRPHRCGTDRQAQHTRQPLKSRSAASRARVCQDM